MTQCEIRITQPGNSYLSLFRTLFSTFESNGSVAVVVVARRSAVLVKGMDAGIGPM